MQTLLLVVYCLVSVALVIFVLLQRSEGGALGMGGGGGGMGGLFTPRGAADTLTRTTSILAVVFFPTSLALALLSRHGAVQIDSGFSAPARPRRAPSRSRRIGAPAVPTPHYTAHSFCFHLLASQD